jgi:uncharacterized membrane protein
MPVLAAITVLSFTLYIFYKVKSWRTKRLYEKRWVDAKASVALGFFVFLFGLNRLFINPSTVIVIVCIVLLVVGGVYAFYSIKALRYYKPLAFEEVENQKR